MLKFLRRENQNFQNRSQDQGHEPQEVRGSQYETFAQGYEETPLGGTDPVFPDSGDAQQLHDAALEAYGQPYAILNMPEKLEGAMGRAANYWHYGEGTEGEKMADSAGALAHGIGAAQAFEDGNKRTAYLSTRRFLNDNGYGHLSPLEGDDEELADHLIGHGEGTHSLEDTQQLFRSRLNPMERTSNILDPIHDTLDPRMWDNPASPEPILKPEHSKFIHQKIWETLEAHGYDGMERWLSLVLTGSLTTYQYADSSDCDISLFIDTVNLPEWSRAEMIGVMVEHLDGTIVPGTPFPLQDFVVGRTVTREDLYKPGMRSGYELATDTWIVPPDKSRVHDVEYEMNLAYTQALEAADKMDRLLRFEPLQAARYWHTIHKKRARDMVNGEGDYANSNIVYKMLANRGMFDRISEITGEHIAKVSEFDYRMQHEAPGPDDTPMYEMERDGAADLYTHPEYYTTREPEYDNQSVPAIMAARNNPSKIVTIHRSGPTNQINPGDWVTPSKAYAKGEGRHPTDPSQDMPVHSARVPASTLFWDGNSIHEFGYHGPAIQGRTAKPPASIPQPGEPGFDIDDTPLARALHPERFTSSE